MNSTKEFDFFTNPVTQLRKHIMIKALQLELINI